MKDLVLVDARNLSYRAHFSNRGSRNGAVHGFGSLLIDLAVYLQCRDIILCWDNGIPGRDREIPLWRKAVDSRYKSNRKPDDVERIKIQEQLPLIAELMRQCGYVQIGVPGVEADDLISVIAHRLAARQVQSQPLFRQLYVYSNDEDYYGLPRQGLTLVQPTRGQNGGGVRKVYMDGLAAEHGTPLEFSMVKAMAGCVSDAVKGIPLCGPVKAKRAVALGADPRKSWEDQPEEVRTQWPGWEQHWHEANLGWKLVSLPSNASDIPTHGKAVDAALAVVPKLLQGTSSTETLNKRVSGLIKWLDVNDLSLLAMRRNMLINPSVYPVTL